MAAYYEFPEKENARSSTRRDPVAELTRGLLTSMPISPTMFENRASRTWLLCIEHFPTLVGMAGTRCVQDDFNHGEPTE